MRKRKLAGLETEPLAFRHRTPERDDAAAELAAFAEAGADVLYAPGLKTREEIDAVVRAVAPKPVNVVMGLSGPSFSLDVLASLGVKRVSLGSSLARAGGRWKRFRV